MGLELFAIPSDEPVICRGCAGCGAVLDVTPEDHLVCPRCGRVRVWTVSVNGRLVAAGREVLRAGIGIWLADDLDDLLPATLGDPAPACGGQNEDG